MRLLATDVQMPNYSSTRLSRFGQLRIDFDWANYRLLAWIVGGPGVRMSCSAGDWRRQFPSKIESPAPEALMPRDKHPKHPEWEYVGAAALAIVRIKGWWRGCILHSMPSEAKLEQCG